MQSILPASFPRPEDNLRVFMAAGSFPGVCHPPSGPRRCQCRYYRGDVDGGDRARPLTRIPPPNGHSSAPPPLPNHPPPNRVAPLEKSLCTCEQVKKGCMDFVSPGCTPPPPSYKSVNYTGLGGEAHPLKFCTTTPTVWYLNGCLQVRREMRGPASGFASRTTQATA